MHCAEPGLTKLSCVCVLSISICPGAQAAKTPARSAVKRTPGTQKPAKEKLKLDPISPMKPDQRAIKV